MAHLSLVIDGGVLWFRSTEAENEASRLPGKWRRVLGFSESLKMPEMCISLHSV